MLMGGGPKGNDSCPAGQKMDEAVARQQDLLAEFEKIADELNRVLANLEGSTLVKRLKAQSRLQYRIAGRLGDLVSEAFGAPSTSVTRVEKPQAVRVVQDIQGKLAKPVTLDQGIPEAPLKDVLEFLQDRYDLTIHLDKLVFEKDLHVKAIETSTIKLPVLTNVSLDEVLNRIADQIKGTCVVRRDSVEITTRERVMADKSLRPSQLVSQESLFKVLAGQEAKSSQDVSNIMDDMQSYFERRRFTQFKAVLDEMLKQDVVGSLRQLGDDLQKESGVSMAQCEFWSDTLDRWAEDLVEPASGGS
jgi:hypothetical protein